MITTKKHKEYTCPFICVADVCIHEELLSHTIIVDPGEEGNQEDAEVREREWEELPEENDVWKGRGLW